MANRIDVPRIERDARGGPVRRVTVTFGNEQSVQVACREGTLVVRLKHGRHAIVLGASGAGSQFERAINLLRLHLGGQAEP